jgi:hypothetical protein
MRRRVVGALTTILRVRVPPPPLPRFNSFGSSFSSKQCQMSNQSILFRTCTGWWAVDIAGNLIDVSLFPFHAVLVDVARLADEKQLSESKRAGDLSRVRF